jgi:hypothetical protein
MLWYFVLLVVSALALSVPLTLATSVNELVVEGDHLDFAAVDFEVITNGASIIPISAMTSSFGQALCHQVPKPRPPLSRMESDTLCPSR